MKSARPQKESSAAADTANYNPDAPNLLNKYLTILSASTDPRLSAADLSTLIQLTDYYNLAKGCAWPSMATLARNTGRATRTIADSVSRLCELGYLNIARHGNRYTSNRYEIIWRDYARPEKPDIDTGTTSMQPSASNSMQPTAAMCAADRHLYMQPTAQEPSYEPEHKAMVSREGDDACASSAADAGVVAVGAPRQLAAASVTLQYPEFWAAYPKKRNTMKAEAEIRKAIANGASLADILNGARAYAAYVAAQPWGNDAQYTKDPVNFVAGAHWLDDWTIKEKPPASTKARSVAPSKAVKAKSEPAANRSSAKTGAKRKNPEFKKWEAELKVIESETDRAREWMYGHIPSCPICKKASASKNYDAVCEKMQKKVIERDELRKVADLERKRLGPAPSRWIYE